MGAAGPLTRLKFVDPRSASELVHKLDEADDETDDDASDDDEYFRVRRSLKIVIVQGRGIGHVLRVPGEAAGVSTTRRTGSSSGESPPSRPPVTASLSVTPSQSQPGGEASTMRERDEATWGGGNLYAEVVYRGQVWAKTALSKGPGPAIWRESFTFQ